MSAEDEDMSNALMNDMADALRSAGLGSMLASGEEENQASELEEMMPWEREIYLGLLINFVKEENKRAEKNNE